MQYAFVRSNEFYFVEFSVPDEDDEMKFKCAETLDLCMEQLFSFIDREYGRDTNSRKKLRDLLLNIFENLILPTYNSHHIQFSIFYYCSLKVSLASHLQDGVQF